MACAVLYKSKQQIESWELCLSKGAAKKFLSSMEESALNTYLPLLCSKPSYPGVDRNFWAIHLFKPFRTWEVKMAEDMFMVPSRDSHILLDLSRFWACELWWTNGQETISAHKQASTVRTGREPWSVRRPSVPLPAPGCGAMPRADGPLEGCLVGAQVFCETVVFEIICSSTTRFMLC